jgi:phage shock protein PspC (stress-responsive transcriptional regulator)
MTAPLTPEAPRKLTRSTSDSWLGGVAGGLGNYFGLDPVLFRIAFAISIFFGGLGILAYLGLLAFLPRDDGHPAWMEGRSRTTTIVAAVAIAVIAVSFLGPRPSSLARACSDLRSWGSSACSSTAPSAASAATTRRR